MKRIALMALGLLLWSTSALAMEVQLAWDPNTETDLGGYKVYYSETGTVPFNGTGASNGISPQVVPLSSITPSLPQWTVKGLDALKKYYFAATAYDTEVPPLESGYSNIVTVGPIQYILTTTVSGTGGTIAPTTGAFAVAQVVALTATPASGYRVRAWTGTANDTSKATTNTVTMTAAKTVTVSFELIPTAPAAPKNMRVQSVTLAEGSKVWQLASDPMTGVETISYYAVGSDWKTVPYREVSYKGKQKALIVEDLGNLGTPVSLYYKVGNSAGESPTKHLTVQKSSYVYDYVNSTSVLENAMWW